MTSAVYARTKNLGLGLITFSFPNWADDANDNMTIIDAAMSVIGVSVKGAWENNTAYNKGDLVVDTDGNTLWRCQVNHTSAGTGTFADDRVAHPTYWIDASTALHARGQWTTATTYAINDVVYKDANKYSWAMATQQFVSGASYDTDVAAGKLVIITDTTQTVTDATAAKNAAQTSATNAANSATAASGSATAASGSATTATTQATNASNSAAAANTSAGNAATSATNASNSATAAANSATAAGTAKTGAETARDQAQAIYNSMYPDAASDGFTYGRKNGAWAKAAPLDSPVLTGDPKAPTPASTDNDTSIATTAFVKAVMATVGGATALPRNRIVNAAMQISQENGDVAGGTNSYYIADQWQLNFSSSAGAFSSARAAAITPQKSKYRLRTTVVTADASLAAGEFLTYVHRIEGQRIADFGWGAAGARSVVLRFGFTANRTGTFSIALVNGATNRSYVQNFVYNTSGVDQEYTFAIPGDVTGTWASDNTLGMLLYVTLAAGSTYTTAPGAWTAGLFLGGTGISNGMDTASVNYNLYDVGLYVDPLATGVAPPWEMPDEIAELQACQRYWESSYAIGVVPGTVSGNNHWSVSSGTLFRVSFPLAVRKRAQPSISVYNPITGASGTIRSASSDVAATMLAVQDSGYNMSATVVDQTTNSWHYVASSRM